jgi:hypothetical protein
MLFWRILLISTLFGMPACMLANGNENKGSAQTLRGKIFVYSIFVNIPRGVWTDDQTKEALDCQKKALQWLKSQANNYHVKVSFETKVTDAPVTIDSILSFRGNGYDKWVRDIFSKTKFKTPDGFADWVKNNTDCTSSLFLVYTCKRGRSYAVSSNFTAEGATLYFSDINSNILRPAVVAHEVLHLFGAWDLYQDYVKDREALISLYFPKDIMLREDYYVNDCKIEKLTAWLVGLTSEYHDYYLKFKP